MTEMKIPEYWTPEQATAVFEFVEELREAILIRYQLQIMEQLHSERSTGTGSNDLFDERDIPF